MDKLAEPVDIEVARLRLDIKNPRLAVVPPSQRDAVSEMAADQGQRLLALCRHIAQNGLNPMERFAVIADDEGAEMYNVLDGNRRLAALRVLENPELLKGKVSEAALKRLKEDAESFAPVIEVPCVIFATSEDADPWILLMHQSGHDGAGSVEWTNQQKARHRERMGSKEPHLQILDFVTAESKSDLSGPTVAKIERGKYPLSTLERVIQTPAVRQRLGIDVVGGEVVTRYPKPEVLRGLRRVVDEIGSGAVKVGQLMTIEDRIGYVGGFARTDLPTTASAGDKAAPLTQAPDKVKPKPPGSRDMPAGDARQKLIPGSFTARIPVTRINDIYRELKQKLNADNVPNATGVLFRVFLELSVDDYFGRHGVSRPSRDNLNKKLEAAAQHLEDQGLIGKKALTGVRAAIAGDSIGVTTVLNALVHNPDMTITGNELKSIWTRFEPFVQALWAESPDV